MSNKRNATLTNAAFYTVLLFCLLGVGAGAYLLLFPGTDTDAGVQTSLTDPAETPKAPSPVTEIIQPVIVPEIPEVTDPLSADPLPAGTTPTETEPPEISEEVAKPVSAPPDTPVTAPTPSEAETAPVSSTPALAVIMPLEGEIVAAFSMDTLVYNATLEDWRTHDGVDISAEAGTGVLAAAAGTVADIREDGLLGTIVVLQHSDGYRTTYASLAPELAVKFGQRVESGQLIGAVGTSAAGESANGPHLHFSVSRNGSPLDPMEYLAS